MRISLASSAAAAERSGLITSCVSAGVVAQVDEDEPAVIAPARSPAGEREPSPTCVERGSPHMRSRQLIRDSLSRSSSWATVTSALPARRIVASPGPTTTVIVGSDAAGLRQLALERAARIVGVARRSRVGEARRATPRRARAARPRRGRRRRRSTEAPRPRRPPASSARIRRSIPAPKPTPGVGGPPISSTR